ncbi:MAG: phosphatase PAP2 family protein [Chloroflexota bacterium]
MFENLESGISLDFILWLQDNRTGWMEILSEILSELGAEFGYIAIFGVIYWAINRREGLRLVFALVAIALVTFFLKDILGRPRPFQAFPDLVMPVFEADGNGLPSGHTSFAVMIWGYIALWVRKGWMGVFALVYIALQAFGRMVTGVHYPQDIVLGLLVGSVTLIAYVQVLPHWDNFWREQNTGIQVIIATAIPLILAVIAMLAPLQSDQIEAYLTMLGLALGAGLAVIVEPRISDFIPHPQPTRQMAIFVLGTVLTVAVLFGLSPIFDAIAEDGVLAYSLRIVRYGTAGFVAIAIVPYLGTKLSLMQSRKNTRSSTILASDT